MTGDEVVPTATLSSKGADRGAKPLWTDEELHRQCKVFASENGYTLQKTTNAVIRAGLEYVRRHGIPVSQS